MRTIILLLSLLIGLHSLVLTSNAASESPGTGKAGPNQGLTLDEIGRGLKSAAKNIEEEIPKIGPAIGKTFKKVTGGEKEEDNSKDASTSQHSTKSKK
ncbi:MAG: hypothetical protein R3B37_05665 [Nitrospira sp.]|nr:hypothetical protein [Nitrospira sp.]